MKILKLDRYIKNKALREWVEALIFAVIVALIFRTWFYAPYRVPTGSMIHTIEIGDHLFANKHAYGFVVPFTSVKLFASKVRRNDIIVFPSPRDPSIDFIKRVIAIGGDELEIKGEEVYVNGKKENGKYIFWDDHIYPLKENMKLTLPEGKIWVMGDNRRNSNDSRYWGWVDEKTVEGRASIIYWSHDPSKSLLSGYRFDRIGSFFD